MNLQQAYDQTQAIPDAGVHCLQLRQDARPSCGRPFPSVRRLYAGHRRSDAGRTALIAITQRDDTVVLRASEARRLAQALMRAAGRR